MRPLHVLRTRVYHNRTKKRAQAGLLSKDIVRLCAGKEAPALPCPTGAAEDVPRQSGQAVSADVQL